MNSSSLPAIAWHRLLLLMLCALTILQSAVFLGQLIGGWLLHHQANDQVYERILLDSFYLDVGNDALSTSVNEQDLRNYLHNLNGDLEEHAIPVRVISIQEVQRTNGFESDYNQKLVKSFASSEQTVTVTLANLPLFSYLAFSPLSVLAAILLGVASYHSKRRDDKLTSVRRANKPITPKLVINLEDKTMTNNVDSKVVNLQNKPFCFYTALVQYCIEHPESILSHHQDIPSELTALCNKVFGRLIELGHTKRKRPDFNANLEKTLSEIRSALDDLFADHPSVKEKYYPPRAQGEGSRSKQHSFALRDLKGTDIEITHT